MVMDVNADVGEGFPYDDALLRTVTSANVACGFHAGDDATMARTCALAAASGVAIGAQVSYDDRPNFGRVEREVPPALLATQVAVQIAALDRHARLAGSAVTYVKPHGALYNRIVHDQEQARAVVNGVQQAMTLSGAELAVLGLPGSAFLAIAEQAGLRVVPEAFADRAYTPQATLVPRSQQGAVIWDVDAVVARSVQMALGHDIEAVDGSRICVAAQSLCVHGDTEGAAALAAGVRAALESAGITVASFVGDA
jgi:UPF0271 protein